MVRLYFILKTWSTPWLMVIFSSVVYHWWTSWWWLPFAWPNRVLLCRASLVLQKWLVIFVVFAPPPSMGRYLWRLHIAIQNPPLLRGHLLAYILPSCLSSTTSTDHESYVHYAIAVHCVRTYVFPHDVITNLMTSSLRWRRRTVVSNGATTSSLIVLSTGGRDCTLEN